MCESRLLFNYTSSKRSKLNNNELTEHFSNDHNYFIIPYIYDFYFVAILGMTALSPHLLPLSFYLLNKKTSLSFYEWN